MNGEVCNFVDSFLSQCALVNCLVFFFPIRQEPASNLNELFLNDLMDNLADIFVIGTQESYSETTEWLIGIQETIGPTHVLFHSETLGTICLAVFIRRELIWYCSGKE